MGRLPKKGHSVPTRTDPKASPQHEKLLYFVMLRQMEAPSAALGDAYGRLSDAASAAAGWDLRTVILDWLETELRSLRQVEGDSGTHGVQLMRGAVALSNALGQ